MSSPKKHQKSKFSCFIFENKTYDMPQGKAFLKWPVKGALGSSKKTWLPFLFHIPSHKPPSGSTYGDLDSTLFVRDSDVEQII